MTHAPILIVQISDLHIKAPGELAYGRVDTAAALARCVDHLNRLTPRPDLVVISGDLVDTAHPDEYAHLKRLLQPLTIPFAAVPGNHDGRGPMRAAFPDQPYARTSGPLDLVLHVGALDLLLLDSSVPGAPHGGLDAVTLAWLDTTLAVTPERPALIVLHHPPIMTGIAHMDRQNLRNAGDLAAILRGNPRARLVAAGHVHRAITATFAGVTTSICPAPNHAVDLDLAEMNAPSFRIEPPAFHLHVWLPGPSGHPKSGSGDGQFVTHLVPIGLFDGPHPFFGADGRLL